MHLHLHRTFLRLRQRSFLARVSQLPPIDRAFLLLLLRVRPSQLPYPLRSFLHVASPAALSFLRRAFPLCASSSANKQSYHRSRPKPPCRAWPSQPARLHVNISTVPALAVHPLPTTAQTAAVRTASPEQCPHARPAMMLVIHAAPDNAVDRLAPPVARSNYV